MNVGITGPQFIKVISFVEKNLTIKNLKEKKCKKEN